MPKPVAVRDSQLRTTVAEVTIKVAREMVSRGEAKWTGNSRSIRLVRKEQTSSPKPPERAYSRRGLSCVVNGQQIERYIIAQNSGTDAAFVGTIDAAWGRQG